MGDIVSSIIGGAGSLLSTAINNATQMRLARENMQWQQQENERAYQRDINFWNMQNQYNSPAAQRQRLEEAGMNAQLAFGNGIQGTTGNSSGSISYNPANAIMPDIQPYQMGEVAYNLADRLWQHELFNQQKKLQDAQIGEINSKTLRNLQHLKVDKATEQYIIDSARENANQIRLANENLSFRNSIQSEQWELDKQISQMHLDISVLDKEAKKFSLDFNRDARDLDLAAKSLQNNLTLSHIYISKSQQYEIIVRSAKARQDIENAKTINEKEKILVEYEREILNQRKSNFSYMSDREFAQFVSTSVNDIVDGVSKLSRISGNKTRTIRKTSQSRR